MPAETRRWLGTLSRRSVVALPAVAVVAGALAAAATLAIDAAIAVPALGGTPGGEREDAAGDPRRVDRDRGRVHVLDAHRDGAAA